MKHFALTLLLATLIVVPAPAAVVLNEIFINPPGSAADETKEFIELLGTPGMKLDGYALACISGTLEKYYTLNTLSAGTFPNPRPEIDEFFSLDGLSLGGNGILVIGIGQNFDYGAMLSDSNFHRWTNVWNGGLDTNGKLENDGSKTVMLVRRRPGATQADPGNPLGLRWGKDIANDTEVIRPVETDVCAGGIAPGRPCRASLDCPGGGTCVPGQADQYGDGNIDKGESDNVGGTTLDLKGASTPGDAADDLEIVDEVSYEHERGWEYDQDDRNVDDGSTNPALKDRNVHALGDPQGMNPDCLTRVDYRTKGPGWTPSAGGTGALPSGNNWQDTATEQWVRGESVVLTSGAGAGPWYGLDHGSNTNPDAIQPYFTQVPTWLADGQAPDYNFAAPYQIMAGRVNALAAALIPGDSDRDGDADADDIVKTANVFGDDDWTFSNSFEDAPESDDGDPAVQTRPWDVDVTGDHGVEASDLQWSLNFQGDVTGRIRGRLYADAVPSTTGIFLNPNTGVGCTVSTSVSVQSGRSITELFVGDMVEVTVLGRVSSGANNAAGQENGVMQAVHDLVVSSDGIVKVMDVTKLGPFATTRASLEAPQGVDGDLGIHLINAYTTSFTQGLAAAAPLYRVTLLAIGEGSADLTIRAAAEAKFAASTPHGVKVGHTDTNGNPETSAYPATISLAASAATTGACCLDGACSEGAAAECAGFVCNVADHLPAGFVGCFGDADGNGVVNAGDRGFISANIGQSDDVLVCLYDMDGNGTVNAGDRGFVSANIGLCQGLPDYQNGSGLNGGTPDDRFSQAEFMGLGTTCAEVTCP